MDKLNEIANNLWWVAAAIVLAGYWISDAIADFVTAYREVHLPEPEEEPEEQPAPRHT